MKTVKFSLALLMMVFPTATAECIQISARAQEFIDSGLKISETMPNSEEEADCYRKAITICPSSSSAHFNLAYVLHMQSKFFDAIHEYQECIKYDPFRRDAFINLGNLILMCERNNGLYEAWNALNRANELIGFDSKQNLSDPNRNEKINLFEIETKIHAMRSPVVYDSLSTEAIISILSRPVLRNGASPYQGPRLALVLDENWFSSQLPTESPSRVAGTGKVQKKFAPKTPKKTPQLLANLRTALSDPELRCFRFTIQGHTDNQGNSKTNHRLARQRAEQIKRWLENGGTISPTRLIVESWGEERPIFPNDSDSNRMFNARIEIERR